MPVILGLEILAPVFFAGILLVMLSQASSTTTRPHQENPGLSSAFTWATDLIGNLWHHIVRATVSHFAAAHLQPLTRWFSGLNTLVIGTLRMMEDTVTTVTAAVERLTGHTIPQAAKKAAQPALSQAKTASKTATQANAKASSTSTALTHYRVATDKKVAHATVAVDVSIPKQIGRINTRVGHLEGEWDALRGRTKALEDGAIKTWDWIRSHPLAGVTAAMGAAVAVALSRLGFGMFRCRSWQNVGKRLTCGNGTSLLNLLDDGLGGLLGALLTVEAVANLEQLVKVAQEVEGGVARGIHDLLSE